jgi:hypothetical protein
LVHETHLLNVKTPTSFAGISNVISKAFPGNEVASTCMSFMKASTGSPEIFIHRALMSFAAGSNFSSCNRRRPVRAVGYERRHMWTVSPVRGRPSL